MKVKLIVALAVLLVVVLAICLSTVGGDEANTTDTTREEVTTSYPLSVSKGLKFITNYDGTCYISGAESDISGDIFIPEKSPKGDTVTAIASNCFSGAKGIKSVVIPNSVKSIGEKAFEGCDSIESISVPFVGKISSPEDNTHFSYIFGKVPESLKKLVITGGGAVIGEGSVRNCAMLESVTISDSVQIIESYAFYGCKGLKSVKLGKELKTIGSSAFAGCSSLSDIVLPDNLSLISNLAFERCTSLTGVTVPDGVTTIGELAFSGCTALDVVVLGEGLDSIQKYAFNQCVNIKSITLPKELSSLSSYAFSGCTGIESLTVDDDNPNYYSDGNCIIEKDTATLVLGCKSSVIPNGVKSIANAAFESCEGLESITVPESVKEIGENAFYRCSNLRSVTFADPNGWTAAGDTVPNLTDAYTASVYLTDNYSECKWIKN